MTPELVWPGEAVEAENARAELSAMRSPPHAFNVCRRKIRHETEGDAFKAAKKLAARDQERGNERTVRVYSCPVCGSWHLTSKPLQEDA